MADILSDLNPIPVVFADGQQPTAKMLNAWANQIDVAFSIVGRILGDVDAESSDRASYITNLIRALGSMGWINPRLPSNLVSGAASAPTIVEKLVSGVGYKEATLTFTPATNGALANIFGDFDADNVYGDDWLKVAPGSPNPAINLNAANKYTVSGRRVLTSTPIIENAKLQYRVNPQSTDGYQSYAPGSGANVVPSLYEIAAVNNPGGGITDLCTLSEAGGNLYIGFPYILRAMNPIAPFSALNADVLNLAHDGGGDVRWLDLAHTPKYTVPVNIMALIDEDNRIPDGLVSLWINRDGHQTQVVNHNSEDQIAFFYDPGFPTRIRIQLPAELIGAMPHDDDIGLINQYIVAFAGNSITEALVHERAYALRHKHDGSDDSASIEAMSLVKRFDATKWFFPVDRYNHFPQYLSRSGYTLSSDPLNRDNAILGNVLIGTAASGPSNTTSPISNSAISHKLYLGSTSHGAIYFDGTDDEGEFVSTQKVVVDDAPLRITGGSVFLGEAGLCGQLHWDLFNNILVAGRVSGNSLLTWGTTLKTGVLQTTDLKLLFVNGAVDSDSFGFYGGADGPTYDLALKVNESIEDTRLLVGGITTDVVQMATMTVPVYHWVPASGDWAPMSYDTDSGGATHLAVGSRIPWRLTAAANFNPADADLGDLTSGAFGSATAPSEAIPGWQRVTTQSVNPGILYEACGLKTQIRIPVSVSGSSALAINGGALPPWKIKNAKFVLWTAMPDNTTFIKVFLKSRQVWNSLDPDTLELNPLDWGDGLLSETVHFSRKVTGGAAYDNKFVAIDVNTGDAGDAISVDPNRIYFLEIWCRGTGGLLSAPLFNLYGVRLKLFPTYIG